MAVGPLGSATHARRERPGGVHGVPPLVTPERAIACAWQLATIYGDGQARSPCARFSHVGVVPGGHTTT